MGKLYILIGKSASGKDSIYKKLLEDAQLGLQPYVGYTTRPIRTGEQNGREYFFVTEQNMRNFEQEGRLIEKRVYHTVHGDWYYFSVDQEESKSEQKKRQELNPGQDEIDPTKQKCESGMAKAQDPPRLYIGTLESYLPIRDFYGAEQVVPLYIQVDDGVRLQRALDREKAQANPRYAEMCRRFLVDEEDFSEEKLLEAGITRRFYNDDLERCLAELKNYILQQAATVA